jgi:sulfopyruvate decarboxylase alpha subunit
MAAHENPDQKTRLWQRDAHATFIATGIRHVSYVPDGGHQGLINLCTADAAMTTTVLTSEQEGVGLSAGLWLGGTKSVLLMQSSGVGNCLNLFSLPETCRLPLVLLITMRGEFAEFVPTQVPMGKRAPAALELMGFDTFRLDEELATTDIVSGAIDHAFLSKRSVAILISQRMIGRKNWGIK